MGHGVCFVEWRITGGVTNYFAMRTIRTLWRMSPSFATASWVRCNPLCPFDFGLFHCIPVLGSVTRCSAWVVDVSPLLMFVQGSLCSADTIRHPILPTMHCVPLARSSFRWWKCIASTSCKRIAATCEHSCFALTPRLPWRRTIWGTPCYKCCATITLDSISCPFQRIFPHQ